MTSRTVAAVAAVICLAGVSAVRVQTQAAAGSQDIMPSLLAEVRGLRAAMEQMAAAGPRVQLALGRLQLQEQRLMSASKRLEDTRTRLADMQRSVTEQQEQLALMETAMKAGAGSGAGAIHGGDKPTAEQLEEMQRHFKGQIERTSADIVRLTNDEALLANDVAGEQARWNDFNQRLEELERSLARR